MKKIFESFWFVSIVVLLTIIIYVFNNQCKCIEFNLSDLILLITFEALMFYTYYTYKSYKQNFVLSAGIQFNPKQPTTNDHVYDTVMSNYSKFPIKVWCEIKPIVLGEQIKFDKKDFYWGDDFRTIQPYGTYQGWFNLQKIFDVSGHKYSDLYDKHKEYKDDEILKFQLTFKYSLLDGQSMTTNPTIEYFYIFKKRLLSTY